MGQCPYCSSQMDDDVVVCTSCGRKVERDEIDLDDLDTLNLPGGTPSDNTQPTIDQQDSSLTEITTADAGEQTLPTGDDLYRAHPDGQSTLDLSSDGDDQFSESDAEFELSGDQQATVHLGDSNADSESDPNATVEFLDAGDLTVDESAQDIPAGAATVDLEHSNAPQSPIDQPDNTDDQPTLQIPGNPSDSAAPSSGVDLTIDSYEAAVSSDGGTVDLPPEDFAGVGAEGDDIATVNLPEGEASPADRTIMFDSVDTEHATRNSEVVGTEGRLNRLWGEVAGSSQNPMHSLQGLGLQASDTVFERVATRRIADANVESDEAADYQIVDKLGEGAMGIVFSARQTGVNRIVAFKTAKPNYQKNDDSRRRFLYEAHITADLDHSNIVPIHELGASEEGLLFYSMKLVQGTEWSRVIRKKTREENLEIFMKVADAMAFAHSKGVIHRDLKPENTMLGKFGEVFVTDWGTAINLNKDTTTLAQPITAGDRFITVRDGSGFSKDDAIALHDGEKILERLQLKEIDAQNPNRFYFRKKISSDYEVSAKYRVLKVMSLAGTPCYMSPEMAGHQLPKIGTRSDIYILGAILYDIAAGKAPHLGSSVTECLRAALKNEVVVAEHEDSLLTIAFKAMATDPKQRFQTVEELQDAVREYRRHAESIALTERSDELLARAISDGDYEAFSRTLFGYRDAIDLWPENNAANAGLAKARLSFGQAAFDKGDYDLVLQTVDVTVDAEAELHKKAIRAKEKGEQREATLKLLQRAVAAIVTFAVFGLSGLSMYAFNQSSIARSEKEKAETAREQEAVARSEAESAKDEAVIARNEAVDARNDALAAQKEAEELAASEKLAKEDAERSAEAERLAKQAAELAAENEKKAKEEEIAARMEAEQAKEQEALAKDEAIRQANIAKVRAAQIQLGEYNSSLALAKSQIESFDVAAGREILNRLQSLKSDVFLEKNPAFDTWGWKRISLLSNNDLPQLKVAGRVTASAVAPEAKMAVVGTTDGTVELLRYDSDKLMRLSKLVEPGTSITALTISPNGDEVVFGLSRGGAHELRRWRPGSPSSQPVLSAGNRYFQHVTYSVDGKRLLAGLNGGIWIWNTAEGWYSEQASAQRFQSIRGQMLSLQSIGKRQALLTAKFQNRLLLGLLNLEDGTTKLIKPPVELQGQLVSASHTLQDNDIILGLNDNRLLVGQLDVANQSITAPVELDEIHRGEVTSIVADPTGRLITSSRDEPVAHVWMHSHGTWQYDTYLTGTPENLTGLGLLDRDVAIGIDKSGNSIVWNIERQKQRRRLQREVGGNAAEYLAPVVGVHPGASNHTALAIDKNGVVDLWSLDDGSTRRIDGMRWSYVGHTPGVELVDSAVDLEQGIVVTAASLRKAEKRYLSDPSHAWEFCIWDQATGAMRRRWTSANRIVGNTQRRETIEQRISLVNRGRNVLFSSDNETRLIDLKTGDTGLLKRDFGTYFAVENPVDRDLVALVKRSGAIRLLDLSDQLDWDNPNLQYFELADPSDVPLKGVWSADGETLYLAFSSGGIGALRWNGQALSLLWASRSLDEQSPNQRLRNALTTKGARISSHMDIDLISTPKGMSDVLTLAVRSRGLKSSTRLTRLEFGSEFAEPQLLSERRANNVQWLVPAAGTNALPTLTSRVHDAFLVDNSRIRATHRIRNQTFVSTTSAQVLRLTSGQSQLMSYGRSQLIDTTADREGRTVYTLHEDGTVWRFTLTNPAEGTWERAGYTLLGSTRIELAPDGKELLAFSTRSVRQLDAHNGREIRNLGPLSAASWLAPSAGKAQRLVTCDKGGELTIYDGQESHRLDTRVQLPDAGRVVGIHSLHETWSDGNTPPREHLLVHCESSSSGHIEFIPLEELPPGAQVPDAFKLPEVAEAATIELPVGTRVEASPVEGIFVTGFPGGTVTAWYATPTWEKSPRQLFDLEGHRGANLTEIAFTSDGQTLITADNNNRLYAWLSVDPSASNLMVNQQ